LRCVLSEAMLVLITAAMMFLLEWVD